MKKKSRLKSYIVRVRSTVIEDYAVEAESEMDARLRMQQGGGALCNEVERPDWEIESVRINE